MSESHINYSQKVQIALRQVVRSVLEDTARDGLLGDHHFYIAFKTQADGVKIPAHLLDRFPEEMTIVLQHKFWGLEINEDFFSVSLSFNQKPETLVIPFHAVIGFVDPSVQFALELHGDEEVDSQMADDGQNKSASVGEQPMHGLAQQNDTPEPEAQPAAPESGDESENNVVALDAFRKK